jgi:predicted permease
MKRLALFLIGVATPRADRESVAGDTLERYDELVVSHGPSAARRWLWRETCRVIAGAPAHRLSARPAAHGDPPGNRSGLMPSLWQDVRYALRGLWRSPAHVATVVFCLGVGIAASATVFSIVNALFYRDLPGVSGRDRLVRVWLAAERPGGLLSAPSTNDVRVWSAAAGRHVEGLTSEGDVSVAAAFDGATMTASAAFVPGNYFRLLGTRPGAGRLINPNDDRAGAPPVVVISHHAWRQRFGQRLDAVGQVISIGGRATFVIGIAPEGFGGVELSELGTPAGSRLDFWLPLAFADGMPGAPPADASWHAAIARLGDGATSAQAAAELSASLPKRAGAPGSSRARVVTSPLNAGPGDLPQDVAIMIALFLAVPLAVLAIGCANVANLQLARATERAREVRVRMSLGASRLAVVRLLAMEMVVLAVLTGAIAMGGTQLIVGLLVSFVPLPIAIDWRVLAFAMIVVGGVMILAGLAPSWLATRQVSVSPWRESGASGGLRDSALRRGLVALQVALSLVLLSTAALFGRSLQHMYVGASAVTQELVVGRVDLGVVDYDDAAAAQFIDDVTARVTADGRVRGVGIHSVRSVRYRTSGQGDDQQQSALARYVSASWFEVMDIRPRAGRLIGSGDERTAAVVNERMAGRLAGEGSAVGQTLIVRASDNVPPSIVQVVGVIANERRPPDPHDDPAIYLVLDDPPASFSLVIRTTAPAAALPSIRSAAAEVDPRVPWMDVTTGAALLARDVSPIRYLVLTAGGLGLLALLLAASGIYAVMSYVVSLRRPEIGIRMAVGAKPGDIVRMILGESTRSVLVGLVIGLLLAIPLFFTVRFLFVGISPLDPAALGIPAAVLVGTAILAAIVPARRGSLVDPVRTLKEHG